MTNCFLILFLQNAFFLLFLHGPFQLSDFQLIALDLDFCPICSFDQPAAIWTVNNSKGDWGLVPLVFRKGNASKLGPFIIELDFFFP